MAIVNRIQKSFTLITKKGSRVRLVEHSLTTISFNLNLAVYRLRIPIFFISSTTNRSEEINRYLGSVNLSLIDIPVNTFETKENVSFNPSKLDFACPEKEVMSRAVVKMLKKIVDMSNANLLKNADGLLSKKSVDVSVEWIGKK